MAFIDGAKPSVLAHERHVCAARASKAVHFSRGAKRCFRRRIREGLKVKDTGTSGCDCRCRLRSSWHCGLLVVVWFVNTETLEVICGGHRGFNSSREWNGESSGSTVGLAVMWAHAWRN